MNVNINDLSPHPMGMNVTNGGIDPMTVNTLAARATELSLDDMRKHTGTGIYLMSAVFD